MFAKHKEMSSASFKLGDIVTYETIDEESYSRGYGLHKETKASTIVSVFYRLANGDIIEEKKLILVEQKEKAQ